MRHDLDSALDQCLSWLRQGLDIKSCLDRYPEHAVELRPLLEVAANIARVQVPAPPYSVRAQGQSQMLSALARRQERLAGAGPIVRTVRRLFWSAATLRPASLRPTWQLATMMLVFVVLASGWLTVAASADSLPGDLLYPVKLASQRARLELTTDPAEHQVVADQFETQRRSEVLSVLQEQRQVDVEFRGVLQQVASDVWVVGGLPVELSGSTVIAGQPTLGARVHVLAYLPGNGQLVGTRLTVKPMADSEPSGPMPTATEPSETPSPTSTPKPEDTLQATDTQRPTETPEPQDTPEVEDTPAFDGTGGETPQPEGTPEGTDTGEETPESGDTPEDDDTGEETPEPEDTPGDDKGGTTPAFEDTPGPEATPEGDTPEPEDTPDSGAGDDSSDPEDTPRVGDTPEAEDAPKDDDTPEPEETPVPGDTPEEDDSPEPEDTPEDDDTPKSEDDDDGLEPEDTPEDEDEEAPEPTEEPDD